MAANIVPKSMIRQNNNISSGYGEVPIVETNEGKLFWAKPGGGLIRTEEEAKAFATVLDKHIRKALKTSDRKLSI